MATTTNPTLKLLHLPTAAAADDARLGGTRDHQAPYARIKAVLESGKSLWTPVALIGVGFGIAIPVFCVVFLLAAVAQYLADGSSLGLVAALLAICAGIVLVASSLGLGFRRVGVWTTFVLATLSLVGVLVQVYLIAGVLFGEPWLQTHIQLGKLVHLLYLLTFVAAVVAFWPSLRALLWAFGLATLGSVQALLAGGSDIDGAVHALHGGLVPIVFAASLVVGWQAWKAIRSDVPTRPAARDATNGSVPSAPPSHAAVVPGGASSVRRVVEPSAGAEVGCRAG